LLPLAGYFIYAGLADGDRNLLLAGILGVIVVAAAICDTLGKRLVLDDSGITYRDMLWRERHFKFAEVSRCDFDPALGLFLGLGDGVRVQWPPHSGNVVAFAAEMRRHLKESIQSESRRRRSDP
jgi:hypothetical protein